MLEFLHKKSNYGDPDIKFKLVLSAFEPLRAHPNCSISWEAGTRTLGRTVSDLAYICPGRLIAVKHLQVTVYQLKARPTMPISLTVCRESCPICTLE